MPFKSVPRLFKNALQKCMMRIIFVCIEVEIKAGIIKSIFIKFRIIMMANVEMKRINQIHEGDNEDNRECGGRNQN